MLRMNYSYDAIACPTSRSPFSTSRKLPNLSYVERKRNGNDVDMFLLTITYASVESLERKVLKFL